MKKHTLTIISESLICAVNVAAAAWGGWIIMSSDTLSWFSISFGVLCGVWFIGSLVSWLVLIDRYERGL